MTKQQKGSTFSGGLIRKEARVKRDRYGSTQTQHWDGRQDARVIAQPVRSKTHAQEG